MFCKWCGNTIQSIDQRCPSCGRETPPLSDCGGFYNLKYAQTEMEQEINSPVKPEPPKSETKCPIVTEMTDQYIVDQKKARKHYKVTSIAMCVMMFLALLIGLALWYIHVQVKELRTMSEQTPPASVATEPVEEKNEETLPTNGVETRYDFQFYMTLGEAQTVEIGVNESLANYAQGGKFRFTVEENETGKTYAASYIPEVDSDSVRLTVFVEPGDNDTVKYWAVGETDILLFMESAVRYQWQIREDTGVWKDIDTSMTLKNEQGIDGVIWNQTDDSNRSTELRCIIYMENSEGDEIVFTVDGIFPTEPETTVTN